MTQTTQYDTIIIGQGLVGSLLGLELLKRGQKILVVDNGHKSSSTTIAAGMMNPLIGQRLSPLWATEKDQQFTITYYKTLEKDLNTSFLNHYPLIRCLSTPLELEYYKKRQDDPIFSHVIKDAPQTHPNAYNPGTTQFVIDPVYQINTQALLSAAKAYFIKHNAYVQDQLNYTDIHHSEDTVTWTHHTAQHIIFCEGAKGEDNPLFSHLRFKNAMGHIATITCDKLPKNTILNHGKWLCPISDNSYKYGATSYWDDTPEQHTQSKENLQSHLENFLKVPYQVTHITSGTRPVLHNRQPVAQWHPNHPNVGIINGLGGQGLSIAPKLITDFITTKT